METSNILPFPINEPCPEDHEALFFGGLWRPITSDDGYRCMVNIEIDCSC